MESIKKEAVILAAQELFAQYGYRKTTIDDIVKKARIAKSTLYTLYSTKEEIFNDVITKEGDQLLSEILREVSGIPDPVEKLKVYIKTRMRLIKKLRNYYSALINTQSDETSFIENARRKGVELEINAIKNILNEGIVKNLFEISNSELTAFAIVSAIKGWDFPWTTSVEMPVTEEHFDYLIDVLFNGIKKR